MSLLDGDGVVVRDATLQFNAIDVSFTEAGSFTLERPGLVVLRVANRHDNGVRYTLRLRQHGEWERDGVAPRPRRARPRGARRAATGSG